MFRSVVFFVALVFSSSFADYSTTYFYPGNGNVGCQVCGGAYDNPYDTGLSANFIDPSPAGSTISQLTFSFNGVTCANLYDIYLNGDLIQEFRNLPYACSCGTCYTYPLITINVPSSYVRQGSNTLFFRAPGDFVDLHSVTITAVKPTAVCGNGVVESGESCDGGACCASDCTFSTQVCRASNGVCDVAESCTGSSASCPADSFAASSQVCRPSNGDCDVAESCSGSSASCPADSFAASSQVCRASNGDCDVAESCSGSSASCPADSFAASSQVCRPAVGACDIAESCSGSSASCPADQVSMSAPCFCARQGTDAKVMPDYFCSSNSTKFYQCLYGPFSSQSSLMSCAPGTACGCASGVECSCGGTRSPCVFAGQQQQC